MSNKTYGRKIIRNYSNDAVARRILISWLICFVIGVLFGGFTVWTLCSLPKYEAIEPNAVELPETEVETEVETEEIEAETESKTEETEVETEVETVPVIVADLISRPIETEPRIDCPLDDATQQMIYKKSQEYNVDFALTMAVIFRESSFNPEAVGKTNDYGLMQINKVNHEWLSKELGITNFLDPEQNVTAGLYILHDLFEKYDETGLVLMAYNMGEPTAKELWKQGIYSTDYAEAILQQADIYNAEIAERRGIG